MATRTGRLVVDPRSGKMVDEYREDQMAVALFDPACERAEDHTFRFVLRSDFTVCVRRVGSALGALAAQSGACSRLATGPRSTCSSTATPPC
jgi:hypothetical protein